MSRQPDPAAESRSSRSPTSFGQWRPAGCPSRARLHPQAHRGADVDQGGARRRDGGPRQRKINKIGFANRILRKAQSGAALTPTQRAKPGTEHIMLFTQEVMAEIRPPYDVLEDNIERAVAAGNEPSEQPVVERPAGDAGDPDRRACGPRSRGAVPAGRHGLRQSGRRRRPGLSLDVRRLAEARGLGPCRELGQRRHRQGDVQEGHDRHAGRSISATRRRCATSCR